MNSERGNVLVVGNSQVRTSLLHAYCADDVFRDCEQNWAERRVFRGEFVVEDGTPFSYVACNVGLLGNTRLDGNTLTPPRGMLEFIEQTPNNPSAIVVMLRGNEFALESLVDSVPKWDFSYQGNHAQRGRQFIPTTDVLNHFSQVTQHILAVCALYRHVRPNSPVYHVAAPAPVESEKHILDLPGSLGPMFERYGVRPFALRLKMYRAMYDQLAGQLERYGVRTLFTPQECLTEAGGLRADYAHGWLHGNQRYGRALIAEFKKAGVYAPV
ncbi:hypothetical protein [Pararobbsia silviterrae]|uniref:SGNH/GDSL hydrolase family protein n=1 Tax=Pararobbsia silviterrae TaxID=1792498 RepID=A0A494Y7W8_9BURK|nr:hypothetical protein [Pararobbsia silviterrae]RKP58466.1 hypothetical protein D7S86_00420 [Pararobbsia silviterrae]